MLQYSALGFDTHSFGLCQIGVIFSAREYRQSPGGQNRQTHAGALALLQEDRGLVSLVDRPQYVHAHRR